MAISVAKQYCPDFNSLIDPLRTLQSFDYFGSHVDQMEFTISTESDEVSFIEYTVHLYAWQCWAYAGFSWIFRCTVVGNRISLWLHHTHHNHLLACVLTSMKHLLNKILSKYFIPMILSKYCSGRQRRMSSLNQFYVELLWKICLIWCFPHILWMPRLNMLHNFFSKWWTHRNIFQKWNI